MNLIFLLSDPVDLSPVLPEPIPPEIYPCPEGRWFDRVFDEFEQYFPDAFHFVIDGCPKPVYYRVENGPDADLLNIPTSSLFPKLFLFSAFSRAFHADPFSLFVPAALSYESIDPFAIAVRRLQKQAQGAPGITFFPARDGISDGRWLEAGETIGGRDGVEFCAVRSFLSRAEVSAAREKSPDRRFYPVPGVLALNTFDFAEALCEKEDSWRELFYLLVNAWKDGRSIGTAMREVITALEGQSLEDALSGGMDRFVCPVDGGIEELSGLDGLLRMLPRDGDGNYTEGEAHIENVRGSLVIAHEDASIRVSGLSNVCCLAADGSSRFCRIR
jgi:mannose-1-phosphate guanylyltransferase